MKQQSKPAEAMIEAGRRAMDLMMLHNSAPEEGALVAAIYTAMRAASPPDDELVEWLHAFRSRPLLYEADKDFLDRIADRITTLATDNAALREENAALSHDLGRQMTIANTECNEAKALRARVGELEEWVEQMGGGCEANGGGLHSAMRQGKEHFCPDCGLMLKRVTYVLPHVKPAKARAAVSSEPKQEQGE